MWENIFVNDTSDKGLISKICKELRRFTPGRQIIQFLKKGKRLEQTFLQGGHTEVPETYEKIFSTASYERCKLKPQSDTTSHQSEWPSYTNQQTSVREDVEKREP